MANRFFTPSEQFADSTGAALAGAQLFFYASGTSTKQNTYTTSALAVANPNPIVLDANGRAGAIWLSNLKYSVVLAPATDTDPPTSPIWTQDPVYTSDYSAVAQFQYSNGNPTGALAGSAASSGIAASVAWDATNNILYVCTTTGTSSTAVWTAVNASSAAAVVPTPQGRLTLTSATPVLNADVTAATTVYYTPYTGLLVPVYNGTSFIPTSIVSELSATLVASHVASNIYDFYIFLLNGVMTLGTGPSWSAGTAGNITAGSCARGTGAGGAALTRLQGLMVNTASMTMRYGDGTTTTTVAANQGTYIGTMFVDGTNGQVSCHVSYGQSRKWGIWNAYNRMSINLLAGDSTGSWNYKTATWRPENNASANSVTVLTGLPEEQVSCRYEVGGSAVTNANSVTGFAGIGWNSTSAQSGIAGRLGLNNGAASAINSDGTLIGTYDPPASIGINTVTALERGDAGAGTFTWRGSLTDTLNGLVVRWTG